jgi:hypothetical protein
LARGQQLEVVADRHQLVAQRVADVVFLCHLLLCRLSVGRISQVDKTRGVFGISETRQRICSRGWRSSDDASFWFCNWILRPTAASVSRTIRVVVYYIDRRPSRMTERFETLALEALQEEWPCGR